MNICLFGAASALIDAEYMKAVEELGEMMARKGHTMIYGGGATGLMGAAARGMSRIPGRQILCRLLRHAGLGAQQIKGQALPCHSFHQMPGKFNAGGLFLQGRTQHGGTLDNANAVRQHQVRLVDGDLRR